MKRLSKLAYALKIAWRLEIPDMRLKDMKTNCAAGLIFLSGNSKTNKVEAPILSLNMTWLPGFHFSKNIDEWMGRHYSELLRNIRNLVGSEPGTGFLKEA